MLIDLLRHGATDREGYLDGKTDHPLSAEGWAQFKSQTDHRNWSSIVSSPLLRAREAAEALAKARNLALRIDEDLTELDLGAWEGRRKSELEAEPAIQTLDAWVGVQDDLILPGFRMAMR